MSRKRRLRVAFAVVAACSLVLGIAAGAQAASPWTQTNLNLGENETVFGLTCEASGFCIGVGGEAVLIQSTAPTAGAGAWTIGHLKPAEGLTGNLRDVSCPSPSLCVAVDYSGGVWTSTEPRAGAPSWQPTKIPKAKSLYDISCPSANQCVLVGAAGLVATTTDPLGGAGAWKLFHLSEEQPLRALSCAGSLCVAGDYEGGLWTTTDAAGGQAAWTSAGRPGGESPSLGITCQSETLCLVGQAGNLLVSSNPTAASAWVPTPLSRRFQIFAASCPNAGLCALSSNNGEVYVSTDPLGGPSTWRTEYLIGGDTNAMFGLSCPTESLCVAGGKYGQLLTTTNPRATGLPEPPTPPPAPPSPAPTTLLFHHPRKTIRIGPRAPAPTVAFRFGAEGQASPYSCRLDDRPFTPCTSPRRYRVGVGPHMFRVRASGPGGTGNRVAYSFRVIRTKPQPRKHHR